MQQIQSRVTYSGSINNLETFEKDNFLNDLKTPKKAGKRLSKNLTGQRYSKSNNLYMRMGEYFKKGKTVSQ